MQTAFLSYPFHRFYVVYPSSLRSRPNFWVPNVSLPTTPVRPLNRQPHREAYRCRITMAQVVNDETNKRYTLALEGIDEPAFLSYVVRPQQSGVIYDLTHTYVAPAMRGRGVAAILVKHAVDHACQNGHKIVPTCSYITTYMKRNPQDQHVLTH